MLFWDVNNGIEEVGPVTTALIAIKRAMEAQPKK
jgi:hypothetical protein